MPLTNETQVANQALDLIGEPYLDDLDTDTTVAGMACRLHFSQALETVLEGHVWSFATRCVELARKSSVAAFLETGSAGDNNGLLFTAVAAGPAGNGISVEFVAANRGGEVVVSVTGNKIEVEIPQSRGLVVTGTLDPDATATYLRAPDDEDGVSRWTPSGEWFDELNPPLGQRAVHYKGGKWLIQRFYDFYDAQKTSAALSPAGLTAWTLASGTGQPTVTGIPSTAAEVLAALQAHAGARALVTVVAIEGSDGTGTIGAMAETSLAEGAEGLFAPSYGSAFFLPDDCLRLIKIDGADIDAPRNRFEIQGRYLLLPESGAPAPVIHYITESPPVPEWPTTFVDAVVLLLAAKIAPKITQNPQVGNDLLAKHEQALGKARSKDTRETRSKENHGPRALSARSGLVNARWGGARPGPVLADPPPGTQ